LNGSSLSRKSSLTPVVFAYVEKEDTLQSLVFQLDMLRQMGFDRVEVLHKNLCFAAFGAVKA
jgi:tRNA (cmo5U34)-methyltransferase